MTIKEEIEIEEYKRTFAEAYKQGFIDAMSVCKTEPQRDDKKCAYAYDKYSEEWYPIYAKRKEDEPQTDCGWK